MHQPEHNRRRVIASYRQIGAIALSIGLLGLGITACNSPSNPTITATDSPSPTASPTASPSPTESPSPTASPSPTESPSPTASPTASPTLSPTGSPSPTTSPTASPSSKAAIETQLATLVSQTAAITVQSVTCPADLTEKAGTRYDCQVQSDIGSFVVVVQPTGTPGKFNWGTRGLLLVSKLNAFIQQSVASRGGGTVTVDCGAQARAAKPGEVFECKVTDAKGAVKTARVTVRDEQGNVYLSGL